MIDFKLTEASIRQQLAGQNIANINTPGFEAREVVPFTDILADANQPQEVSVQPRAGSHARLDGNTVDIDREMGDLKKGAIEHNAYTQILATKIRQMRAAMER